MVYEQAFSLKNQYYRAGFEAYQRGESVLSCPYGNNSLEFVLWQAGWEDAREISINELTPLPNMG